MRINTILTGMNDIEAKKIEISDDNDNIRIVKFKMIVEDILKTLGNTCLTGEPAIYSRSWYEDEQRVWLAVIYDYDKLNVYGKVIMDYLGQLDGEKYSSVADRKRFMNLCKDDMEYRMKAAQSIIKDLNYTVEKECIKYLIFWALMILTVDDTDKEEHLSLICDFAKMLKVSDEEIMDIVQIIRVIYHKEEAGFKLRSYDVRKCFEKLLRQYGYNEVELENELGSMMSSMLNLAFGR